jgi:hypothetical protein
VKPLLAAIVVSLAVLAAWPAAGGAANECKGITSCIPVVGPWVYVQRGVPSTYLLSCPKGAVVGGLDADATTAAIHVDFVGQLGAPVAPGTTTTHNALVRGVLVTAPARAAFRPAIGCIPAGGGGGRTTVSARVVPPGSPLQRYAKDVTIHPGEASVGSISCPAGQTRTGQWSTLVFKTASAPGLAQAKLVHIQRVARGNRVDLTVAASDALSLDLHAAVQVGVECAS